MNAKTKQKSTFFLILFFYKHQLKLFPVILCVDVKKNVGQVSTTVETFQDLSLPIPGKEDLAKLHSSIHQNLPVKTGVCPDTYGSQGWISYIMDSIRR